MLLTDAKRPYVGTQRAQAAYLGAQRLARLRMNYARNPSLEGGNNGHWNIGGSPTATLRTDGGAFGADYMRLVQATTAAISLTMNPAHRVPVLAGEVWTMSAYVRGTPGQNVVMRRALTNGGNLNGSQHPVTSATEWTRVAHTFTMPANDLLGLDVLRLTTATGGHTLDIDGLLLEKVGAVLPYFDGSSPRAEWTGTPNASASTLWAAG